MSTVLQDPRAVETPNYLNQEYGWKSWLFTKDPKRIADTYNKFFTMHGIVMVFFFLIPSIPATLGNFFVPMMIGAKDLAFPRINLLSWYLLVIGGLLSL